MASKALSTFTDQVPERLRQGMVKGQWQGTLPGRKQLAGELGCSPWTVEEAMQRLAKEGLLVSPGAGSRRRIKLTKNLAPPSLRVGILLYERIEEKVDYIVDLQHRLLEAGHVTTIPSKTLHDLKMNLDRISRLVRSVEADAWVIQAGSSEVLKWFAGQATPAFALAGRRRGVDIAGTGPDKIPAGQTAVRRLVELGHRRIVMLAREERRKPLPGLMERAFLNELEILGIATSSNYNLPDWDDTVEGLYDRLNSLYMHTSPTALIIDEVPLYLAVERQLARRGFLAPGDVSLICLDPGSAFQWFQPSVSHIAWDSRPMINRIVKWTGNVARGRDDRRQTFTKAKFIEGGTIGPVRGEEGKF
jgi:DNA-binding LacI/PurR family transcriptional regulator/biotin operon repressor